MRIIHQLTFIIFSIILFSINLIAYTQSTIIVSLNSTENLTSIQAAINNIKSEQKGRTVIYIKNGLYNYIKVLNSSLQKEHNIS